jgi:hypothetical protein
MTPYLPSRNRGALRLTVMGLAVVLTGSPTPLRAGSAPETVEIRGQQMTVWPVADLRERGFDVPDLPRDENAAWVYLEAANKFLDLPQGLSDAFDYAYGKAWPENQPELRTWLTSPENREALALVRKAAQMERCQMPYFGDPNGSVMSVLLPSLSQHRMLARMLVADGRRLTAQKDYRGAMDNYGTVLRMGHHVSDGVTLIETLVGVACWSMANDAVRDLVLRNDMPREELAAITETWKALLPLMPKIQRGFEGERTFGPTMADELCSRPTQIFRSIGGLSSWGVEGSVKPQDGWDRLEARLGRVLLPDRTVKRHMLAYYDAVLETVRLPYSDPRVRDFDEGQRILQIPQWDIISRVLLPSLSRARTLGARCETGTRATSLALALRAYARDHQGKYATTLDDVSADLDPSTLEDPFGGRPFVYARNSDGWGFYSVGPDRTDNGGQRGERWDSENSDIVYTFPPETVEPFAGEAK